MRKFVFIILGIGCGLFSIFASLYFLSAYNFGKHQSYLAQLEETQNLQQAEDLIICGRAEEALMVIHENLEGLDEESESFREWATLLLTASMATQDASQLMTLFEYYPEAFLGHEDAALFLAQAYIDRRLFQNYQLLRNYWLGFEVDEEAWFSLDVDQLLSEGRDEAAIQLLNSRTFVGEADVNRLLWLSQLTMQEDPRESWNHLTKAAKKDPINPQTCFLRGKLLETIGDEEAAVKEYLGSLELDPNNTLLQDYVGSLLLRQKAYPDAVQFWSEKLNIKSDDQTWLNLLFWKQVARPSAVKMTPPKGNSILQQYIQYLHSLNSGEFWKQDAFNQLLYARDLLKTEQSTFWLKLLDSLKNNRLREAAHLLNHNPFYSHSWDKSLEDALTHLFVYKGIGPEEINAETLNFSLLNLDIPDDYYSVLAALAKHSQPGYPTIETTDELDIFLNSKDAVAAIFLRAGWNEAAHHLYPYESPCTHAPEWVLLDMIVVLADNVSLSKALTYSSTLPYTSHLSDLTMKLLKQANDSEQEIFALYQHAQQNSESGYRIASFLSQVLLAHDQDLEAKKIILNQKKLHNSTPGQEMLARIALHQGDTSLAERIYTAIERDSIEAKSYHAKKAFQDKNWVRAKQLTEELLSLYPDNATLQENLRILNGYA